MNHQAYKDFNNVSEGRRFLNQELLWRLAEMLPRQGASVLNVGVHKYWDYACIFNNPGRLCDYKQMDTHPGGGDQPAPDFNMSIETCDAIPNDSFDAIVMIGVFEYLDHSDMAFNQIHRMLKPGGIALLAMTGKGEYDDSRGMGQEEVYERVKPLRVLENYSIFEGAEKPKSQIVICKKI